MAIKSKAWVDLDEKLIEADLRKFSEICCETIAKEAAAQINRFAYEQMFGYYGEYKPDIYERTEQMLIDSHKEYYAHHGNVYEGGIEINSAFTNHKPKGITEEEIYDEVWIMGGHGWTHFKYGDIDKWRYNQGETDRLLTLKQKAYSKETKQKLLSLGIKKARNRNNGYSILKF